MNAKPTNPLSRYFGEMEKKPLRKEELKSIFDQLEAKKAKKDNPFTKKPLSLTNVVLATH